MANPWAEIRDRVEIRTFCWLQPIASRSIESVRKDFNHSFFFQPYSPPDTSEQSLHCLICIQISQKPIYFAVSLQDSSLNGKLKITLAQTLEYLLTVLWHFRVWEMIKEGPVSHPWKVLLRMVDQQLYWKWIESSHHISLRFNLFFQKEKILIRIRMLKVMYTLNDSIDT